MKKWLGLLSTVWIGVATHKFRSFLTVLGIVIGVAAVIALMSIGKGAESSILSRIQGLGSNLVTISPGFTTQQGGVRSSFGSSQSLTLEDAIAIAEQVPYLSAVAPSYSSSLQVIVGSNNLNSRVTGVTPEYMLAYNLETAYGDFITDYDYQRASRVAVLGSNVEATLFGDDDPIGQRIRLGSNIVTVIGVLQSKGATMGSSDDAILVPLSTLQQMAARTLTSRGEHVVSSIALTVTDEQQTSNVIDDITYLLRDRHKLAADAEDDFRITSMEEIAATMQEAMNTMTLLLGAIAAISLLVGGIGVMNIMLVSVLERTREIGIRKALGARERDIWAQFLIEAAFLTFIGGIIGVIVGWGASFAISYSGLMTTLVSADIVVLAVSVSVGIGLFFGFYPAWNASRLDPIEALRSE
ncbi:MAG: ABC transporter permease [Chloroflexota bacterium]